LARITVEDCLKKVSNRFLLVNMVAKRVRQIREGSEYLVSAPKNEDIVISLREIAAGKIRLTQKAPEALGFEEPAVLSEPAEEEGLGENAESAAEEEEEKEEEEEEKE
jgi:DNA-directed RNA polymerase subunit omega